MGKPFVQYKVLIIKQLRRWHTMDTKLQQSIENYFHASNIYDSELLGSCFVENSVLYDEGKEYRGPGAIKSQIIVTNKELQVTTEITHAAQKNGETIVTAMLSGNFDGSPIPLDFHFTLEYQKITKLTIVLEGD